jgi:hypothetical protein
MAVPGPSFIFLNLTEKTGGSVAQQDLPFSFAELELKPQRIQDGCGNSVNSALS